MTTETKYLRHTNTTVCAIRDELNNIIALFNVTGQHDELVIKELAEQFMKKLVKTKTKKPQQ